MLKFIFCALLISVLAADIYAVEYKASSLRDPFAPPAQFQKLSTQSPVDIKTSFKLGGIVFEGPKLKAIINNKIVGIGEMVGSARVISISKDGVKLLVDSEEVIIKIEEK